MRRLRLAMHEEEREDERTKSAVVSEFISVHSLCFREKGEEAARRNKESEEKESPDGKLETH